MTKGLQLTSPKKRQYAWVHPDTKRELLARVFNQKQQIKQAAKELNIRYSNAKMILKRS